MVRTLWMSWRGKGLRFFPFVVIGGMAFLIGNAALGNGSKAVSPDEKAALTPVVSPWNGTFYAGEYAGAAPFVSVGDPVQPHTVVCIVDAMRPFEVEAGVEGVVQSVLVNDGDMVRAGQTLLLIQSPDPSPPAPTAVLP